MLYGLVNYENILFIVVNNLTLGHVWYRELRVEKCNTFHFSCLVSSKKGEK